MWGLRCWLSPAAMPLARRSWGTLFQRFSFNMREEWKLTLDLECRPLGMPAEKMQSLHPSGSHYGEAQTDLGG